MKENVKCLIIGSGPAGYTAAIYAARANLSPVLIEGMSPGGQLTSTTLVENFPGYTFGKQGPEIMNDLRMQAERMGADIRSGMITKVDFSKRPFTCILDDEHELVAESVIISTGAVAKWLDIETEQQFKGYGVSTCATCDGFFYKNKTVAVIGGGDAALEEALYLAQLCQKVYLVHRRDELRASKAMQNRVFNTPNIEIKWNCIVDEIRGINEPMNKRVTSMVLYDKIKDSKEDIPVDGIFISIGNTPATTLFEGQVELDEQGYIKTQPGTTKTNIPGVFAAGDVQDTRYRQAVTAAASGCMSALDAERFLNQIE
ncbi:MAG TPA: thioredoxin-disulfide reductase [Bacteroidales bacterium]|jgi:thioredoxin reductase (NADPH)|nr:thioredoxin-disulfide reductase [Bacteroidales bacterium]HOS58224.1 thioredoxin-disulfide reductase [Bacteroidales bacterium]HRR03774.1 thioredoxin-disulfide reductase [Bacteroidales bacterium]HXK73386.1 thioredoxin-disulfide reductase [Bacteroidales bacterium]